MKKHLYSFIILIIFISPGLSSEEFRENDYYRPSLGSAVYQMTTGAVLHYASTSVYDYSHKTQNMFGEQVSGISGGIACQLLADGLFEFCHWFYHSTLNDLYWLNILQDKKRDFVSTFTAEAQDFRPHATQLHDEVLWNKTVNVTRSLINLTFAANFVAKTLIEATTYGQSSTLMRSGARQISLCASIGWIPYYLHELYESYNQKRIRQGDSPSMGAVSAMFILDAVPQAFSFFPVGSIWGRRTSVIFKFYGTSQAFTHIFQILKNIKNRVKGKASVSFETIRPTVPSKPHDLKQALPSPTAHKKPQIPKFRQIQNSYTKKPSKVKQSLPKEVLQPINDENMTTSDPIEIPSSHSSQETFEYPKPKDRIKTREPSKPPKTIENSPKSSPSLTLERLSPPDKRGGTERKIILRRVNELLKFNAVKETDINTLLSKTCLFIGGKTNPIDGSEFAIVFDRDNQRISIKYETPHPASIYEGYKLKRVLNAMETALMYNWDEKSIRQYMKDHDIYSFYWIPKNLLHILWTRPDM